MYRWWLVNATGDRLKIVYRKRIGIQIAIPSHNIQGAVTISVLVEKTLFFDLNEVITFFTLYVDFMRRTNVSFTVRRVLQ